MTPAKEIAICLLAVALGTVLTLCAIEGFQYVLKSYNPADGECPLMEIVKW